MKAMSASKHSVSSCCTASAAAVSPARIRIILDTALLLAVSILVCLISLRLCV